MFLTAIVGVAVRFGLWPSLLASVAASLCYNFFFLPPLYTFTIADPTNVAAFVFFTMIAVVVSNVAARGAHPGGHRAWRGRARPKSLYAFSRKLAGVGTLDDVLWATAYQIALMLKVRVVLLLPEDGVDRGQGRLSAGGHARRGRPRRRQLGLGERPRRRPRLRHAARRQAAVPADAHRPRRRSASSASTATSRARC